MSERGNTALPLCQASTEELFRRLDVLVAPLHRGPGTENGEPLEGCNGCEAEAILEELEARVD